MHSQGVKTTKVSLQSPNNGFGLHNQYFLEMKKNFRDEKKNALQREDNKTFYDFSHDSHKSNKNHKNHKFSHKCRKCQKCQKHDKMNESIHNHKNHAIKKATKVIKSHNFFIDRKCCKDLIFFKHTNGTVSYNICNFGAQNDKNKPSEPK
jgi:hypothetical protein